MKPLPTIFPVGREMYLWLRQGGLTLRENHKLAAIYAWTQWWFERNRGMQFRMQRCASPSDPVLILGLWRSGTTFLHELLSLHSNLQTPKTWQCMNSSTFRLTGPPKSNITASRPMDAVKISNLSPQEDEFALLALGAPSLYRGFFDPRRLPELEQLLSCALKDEDDLAWTDKWNEFLGGLAINDGRLLLKSPNHSFRWPSLVKQLPNSQAIWITRDPELIWRSNLKMWRHMINKYALWPCPENVLESFLLKALTESEKILRWSIENLDKYHFRTTSLDLVLQQPAICAESIFKFLGLEKDVMFMEKASASLKSQRHFESNYEEIPCENKIKEAFTQIRLTQNLALISHGL